MSATGRSGGQHTGRAVTAAGPGRPGRRTKVLLVGWDGVRYDVLRAVDPPTVRSLARRGLFAGTWMPEVSVAETVTAPGWSTILTGVWPDKHRVTTNLPGHSALDRHPDMFTLLRRADPMRRGFVAVDAAMLATPTGPGPILGPDGVQTLVFHNRITTPGGFAACDPLVLEDAVAHLSGRDPDLCFSYFGAADQVAHAHGVAAEYRAAITRLDAGLGRLLEAVAARPTYPEEDWLVVLTTDHGHLDEGGHGGGSWQERQSFVLAAGTGLLPRAEVSNVDIVPTVLTHLGVPVDPSWDLDGTPLNGTGVPPGGVSPPGPGPSGSGT